MEGQFVDYQLLWLRENNPLKFDIPNNGKPYPICIMKITPRNEMLIPTGPVLAPGNYQHQILPSGTYDVCLEVGPPTESIEKVWDRSLDLPEDFFQEAAEAEMEEKGFI
jgi:hypothetical protein